MENPFTFPPEESKALAYAICDRIVFLESILLHIPAEDILEKQKIYAELFILYKLTSKYNIKINEIL